MTETKHIARGTDATLIAAGILILVAAWAWHRYGTGSYTPFDVRSYGAAGDGASNDTAAIQSAIAAVAAVRGTVVVPPGVYNLTRRRSPP